MVLVLVTDTQIDVYHFREWNQRRIWYTEDANAHTTPKVPTAKSAKTFSTIYHGDPPSESRRTRAKVSFCRRILSKSLITAKNIFQGVTATITRRVVIMMRLFMNNPEELAGEFVMVACTTRWALIANNANPISTEIQAETFRIRKCADVCQKNQLQRQLLLLLF